MEQFCCRVKKGGSDFGGSRGMVSPKVFDGPKSNWLNGMMSLPANKDLSVEHGRRLYVESLVERGQLLEFEYSCRGRVGNMEEQTLKKGGYGRKERHALLGNPVIKKEMTT